MIERKGGLIDCSVSDVYLSREQSTVILETEEGALIPIDISTEQARSIQMGISGVDFYRPLTHDLVIKIFDDHDIKIRNLIIHGLKGSTILAELTVEKGGEIFSYDIRPSDGLGLVVRTRSDILVTEEMKAKLGVQVEYERSFDRGSSLVQDQESKVESEERDPVRSMELNEAEDHIILVAELSRIERKEDIGIDVFSDSIVLRLEISGEEYEEKIELPSEVKQGKIEALSFQNKILEVKLEKSR